MMQVYGECIGATVSVAALISQLGAGGCELILDSTSALLDHDFTLWIGAIGPFAATCASLNKTGHCLAVFKEPLDPAIIQHFSAEAL
jgi:hypothetical protein